MAGRSFLHATRKAAEAIRPTSAIFGRLSPTTIRRTKSILGMSTSVLSSIMLPFVLLCLTTSVSALPDPTGPDVKIDVGQRLILTPYIDAGKIQEARTLALVPPLKGTVKSYSGFVTVDKKCDSNMFFWYFPVEGNNTKAPVALWLQGGPGGTSMYGLFMENGPYELKPQNKLKLRMYSWTGVANVLYVDNPVGTGYSFTKSDDCLSKNEVEVGQNLLSAVKQIFKLFPEVSTNPFFVTGESYAGKYVPALGYAILKDKDAKPKINLQGLAIGNGFVDPINQLQYSDYLYQLGLIDDHGRDYFRKEESRCQGLITGKKWKDATLCFDELLNGDMTPWPTYFTNVTGFNFYFNFLHEKQPLEANLTEYMTSDYVRKSIHVGNSTWHNGTAVEMRLAEDIPQSVRPWLEELLDNFRVLVYNGQLDIIVAYPLTVNYLKQTKWSAADAYKKANRAVWRVNGKVAGYSKTAGKLTEVLVRNAGHMVPADQPEWALDMISRLFYNKPFN